jgi:putative aldouronate transport system permease protein
MVRTTSWTSRLADVLIYLVLTIITLISLFPIVHTLAVSFSDSAAASANRVYLLPVRFNLSSYQILLQDQAFFQAFFVSIKRVVLGCSLTLVLTILMAYPLSRDPRDFPARKFYIWFVVATMLFNGGLIPWYITINYLHLLDTIWALVFPYAVPVFNVILLMNFFRGLPRELEEAARVDGAGPWYIMWRIYVPLSLPALATVTLFNIVGNWNSFFDGLILMNNPANYPLQTYIQQLVIQVNGTNLSQMTPDEIAQLMQVSSATLNAAKLIIAMLPILVIYPFLQRFFISGIVMGSLKE